MFNISGRMKVLPVKFDSSVDMSHFNNGSVDDIKKNGLRLNDLALIHYASIHYQTRFENSPSRRFRHTLDTIEPSLSNVDSGHFLFTDAEEPELQKVSSEVIGVGFALAISHRLFDVGISRIMRLGVNGQNKRCDFEIIKDGQRIIVESKGIKKGVKSAKRKIVEQKQSYTGCPKYGIVSHIPRNSDPTNLIVVDPDVEFKEADRAFQIITLLKHYSKVSRLAGFYQLSSKLNKRIDAIEMQGLKVDKFHRVKLDYGNVRKMGRAIEVQFGDNRFASFFAPSLDVGLKHQFQRREMILFGVDAGIIDVLEEQDYDKLLAYSYDNTLTGNYSVLDDGSFLLKEDRKTIFDAIKRKF